MVFNLKKQAIGFMDNMMGDLTLPPGVNPVDAQFLWANVYKDNPNFTYSSAQDMVNDLQAEGIQREIASWSNPDQVADVVQPAENLENAQQQLQTVLNKSKPYNLKTAKIKTAQPMPGQPPMDPMGLNDSPELMGDQIEQQQNTMSVSQPPFIKIEEFRKWVDNTETSQVLQQIAGPTGDHLKEAMEQYYSFDDEGEKGQIAAQIFSDPSFPLREEQGIMGQQKHFGEVDDAIKKIARTTAKKYKAKVFNLKKTAQHKTMDNAILWGPGQTQIDPFLHQPVSDWHIVERNKGFGLVVDDIWNIDYETIWRENIMDKYSRPYKNKEGNWVGGYLNKRFEIDRNIPEANNMQLKPGQLRKPILPEYGNTESRLQAARAAGDIEGAIDKSKPFNWKEASSKKKR